MRTSISASNFFSSRDGVGEGAGGGAGAISGWVRVDDVEGSGSSFGLELQKTTHIIIISLFYLF